MWRAVVVASLQLVVLAVAAWLARDDLAVLTEAWLLENRVLESLGVVGAAGVLWVLAGAARRSPRLDHRQAIARAITAVALLAPLPLVVGWLIDARARTTASAVRARVAAKSAPDLSPHRYQAQRLTAEEYAALRRDLAWLPPLPADADDIAVDLVYDELLVKNVSYASAAPAPSIAGCRASGHRGTGDHARVALDCAMRPSP